MRSAVELLLDMAVASKANLQRILQADLASELFGPFLIQCGDFQTQVLLSFLLYLSLSLGPLSLPLLPISPHALSLSLPADMHHARSQQYMFTCIKLWAG